MDKLTEVLGYECNSILKKKILAEAAAEKITIEQAALRYRLPDLIIVDRGDKIPEKLYPGDVVIKCGNHFKINNYGDKAINLQR